MLSYTKIFLIISLDTELVNLKLIKIVSLNGGTGQLDIKVSSSIADTLKSRLRSLIPKPIIEDEAAKERKKRKTQMSIKHGVEILQSEGLLAQKYRNTDFDKEMQTKISFFADFNEADLDNLATYQAIKTSNRRKAPPMIFTPAEAERLKRGYRFWIKQKNNTSKVSTEISPLISKIETISSHVIFKMKLELTPIRFCLVSATNEIIAIASFDLKSVEMKLDDIYTYNNYFKAFGVKVETRKKSKLLERFVMVL